MNQNYKFKSLSIVQSNEQQQTAENNPNTLTVFETGDTKTIDFVFLDGTRQNFHYSHYITAWMGKEKDETFIKIFFATHLVTIKGYCLDIIYDELIQLRLKSIKANYERYSDSKEEEESFVTEIMIGWKKENI